MNTPATWPTCPKCNGRMAVEETYSRYGRTRVPLFCLDACSTTEKVLSRDRPGWHRTTDLAAPWVKAKQG